MAVQEMRQVVRPGVTENDVWAALHAGNIRRGGEWIETRIMSSGPVQTPGSKNVAHVSWKKAIYWPLIQI